MSTRDEIVVGVPSAAAFGMIALMGVGLARTEGAEPWIAGALALAMAIPALAIPFDPKRPLATVSAVRSALGSDWSRRASAYGFLSLCLFVPYLALWLAFGARFLPLGIAAAIAAVARVVATGLTYATETTVPLWSKPPTVLLFVVQGAAAGLLGLSAVEGLLGFPPSLVVWKAALALIGLGLAGQLWHEQAKAHRDPDAPWLRTDALAQKARETGVWLFRAAVLLGIGMPMAMALAADAQTERVLMPLAFLSHMTGLAAHRLLFFAEAREVRPDQ